MGGWLFSSNCRILLPTTWDSSRDLQYLAIICLISQMCNPSSCQSNNQQQLVKTSSFLWILDEIHNAYITYHYAYLQILPCQSCRNPKSVDSTELMKPFWNHGEATCRFILFQHLNITNKHGQKQHLNIRKNMETHEQNHPKSIHIFQSKRSRPFPGASTARSFPTRSLRQTTDQISSLDLYIPKINAWINGVATMRYVYNIYIYIETTVII